MTKKVEAKTSTPKKTEEAKITVTGTELLDDIITKLKKKPRFENVTKEQTKIIIDTFKDTVIELVSEGHDIRLVGFGSFLVKHRKATTGRNPRTKEEVQIPASTSVGFKPGKEFKNKLNPEK